MPKFAANLTMMYTEHSFLDRFAAAAADRFAAVEYMFPYAAPAAEIRRRLDDNGLVQALFNAPAGDWEKGDRGLASVPGREADCRRSVETALEYAATIGNRAIHVMAGNRISGIDPARQLATYERNIADAADAAAAVGIDIVIEPINRRDMPLFFLNGQDEAQAVCTRLNRPNLKGLFDLYHAQVTEGDLTVRLRRDMPRVGHIQIAGVPDRHEPDLGEINYPHLFRIIDELGYRGWIGCEYRPAGETSAGLGWFAPWRRPV